jgi:hypothetical protein
MITACFVLARICDSTGSAYMGYSNGGRPQEGRSTRTDLGCPGTLLISPCFSSVKIIWCTDGGETRKYLWMSASAGGCRLNLAARLRCVLSAYSFQHTLPFLFLERPPWPQPETFNFKRLKCYISFNGKPMLATHWDGYPSSLGRDLLNCDRSINAVIEVAKAHTIDSADFSLLDTLNGERIRQLAEKHQLTVQEIKAGKRRGNVICADDYEISHMARYADPAEYQYDLSGKQIYFRPLDGWWPDALKHAAEFKLLSEKDAAYSREG